MYNHLELMSIQADVLYLHNQAGRMTTINEPMNQPAPRFFWGQTIAGRIVRFRSDVPDHLVHDILQLIDQGDSTVQLAKVIRALEKDKEIRSLWLGPAFTFQKNGKGAYSCYLGYGRPLYSTSWDNYASLSIAKRLDLHLYGTDISIY
ncbi:hypothetical protein [Paenibacillus sp. NPDC058177]|uniref:hypothetical protein n=1 Tax=Paenibacillus sp. NPDC058177 TaxID=3346369 RepID=UPI0036DA96F1